MADIRYIPTFETQRDELAPRPWTNCNAASVAMLIDLWTYGTIDTSDVAIRRASAVPLTQGMTFRQSGDAVQKLFPQLGALLWSDTAGGGNRNMTWEALRAHLRSGGGAAVAGEYERLEGLSQAGLAVDRWQPSGDFSHCIFACDGTSTDVLIMDPLGHGDYRGDRVSWDILWDFIWKSGTTAKALIGAAHGFTVARPAPRRFRDVPPTAFYAPAIGRLVDAGLLAGYPDGTMRPEQPITRGEAFVLMDRIRG